MKRIFIILVIACFAICKADAQGDLKKKYGIPEIKALWVGDQVPDFTIPKLINPNQQNLKMSDFNDRLIIIDFWNTGCAACIEALPHMDALQKQFGNKIKILPANFQPEVFVAAFWKQNKYTKNLSVPSVVDDKVLMSYFPFVGVPHEVWIYKGKVVAITDAGYVTAAHIEEVLSGKVINWPVKNDFYVFDGRKQSLFPLDSNQVNVKSTFVKYAAIDGFRENIGIRFAGSGKEMDGIVRDPVNKTVRYFNANFPAIYNLYIINLRAGTVKTSLIKPGSNIPNETIWEVTDKYKYAWDPKLSSMDAFRKNGICFESVNPDTGQTDQQVYQSVIKDMNRLLGLNVRWEKRKEKVLILVRTTTTDKLKSKKAILYDQELGAYPSEKYLEKGNLHQFRDESLSMVAIKMNQKESNPYVFDETGYTDNVDMDLSFSSWTDIDGIRKAIKPYGLDLKEEERLVDKLVFTEVNGGLLVDGPMQTAALAKRAAQKEMADPSSEENKAFLVLNKKKPGVITLPSGVQYKIIKKGTDAKPVLTDNIKVHYTGTLVNGKIFTSSYESGRPLTIKLSETIKGWQEVLPLIPLGSKVVLYVPAELAYGEGTGQGRYPKGSNMVFEIELLQIVK